MADCNIRNISEELMKSMKVRAIERNWTLREWCIATFEHTLVCCPPVAKLDTPPTAIGTPKEIAEDTLRTLQQWRPNHDLGCKCFICKPPKEK